jgi:5-methylcytosine-specific restriction endonuclease McrA
MKPETKKFYDTKQWRNRRAFQLATEPLCRMCKAQGLVVPATTADHVRPHRGNRNEMILGALQSLCTVCANRTKQQQETRGYSLDIDEAGYPRDKNHPFWRA